MAPPPRAGLGSVLSALAVPSGCFVQVERRERKKVGFPCVSICIGGVSTPVGPKSAGDGEGDQVGGAGRKWGHCCCHKWHSHWRRQTCVMRRVCMVRGFQCEYTRNQQHEDQLCTQYCDVSASVHLRVGLLSATTWVPTGSSRLTARGEGCLQFDEPPSAFSDHAPERGPLANWPLTSCLESRKQTCSQPPPPPEWWFVCLVGRGSRIRGYLWSLSLGLPLRAVLYCTVPHCPVACTYAGNAENPYCTLIIYTHY